MGGYTEEFKPFLSTEIHKIFLHLLWELDQEARSGCREYTDTARGKMFKFYFHMLRSNPESQKELLSNFFTGGGADSAIDINSDEEEEVEEVDGGGEVIVEGNNKRHGNKVGPPMHENKKLKVNMIQPQVINLDQVLDGVESVNHCTKLLDIYVSSGKTYDDFNNEYMTYYYRILFLLLQNHTNFRNKFFVHNNWGWAKRTFVDAPGVNVTSDLFKILNEIATYHLLLEMESEGNEE